MFNLFMKSNKKRAKRRGFTLIELVIVVVILGILAGVAALTFSSSTADAKKNVALANLRATKSACQLYVVDNSKLPTKVADIEKYIDGELKKALVATATSTAADTPTPGYTYEFKADPATNPTKLTITVKGPGFPTTGHEMVIK